MKDHRLTIKSDQVPEVTSNDFEEKSEVIQVVEETVKVDKKVIDTGKVTVSFKTVEQEETVEETFNYEDVQVDRVEINEYVSTDKPPEIRQEGDTTIIPVLKEVLVVEKKLLLTEELRITKKQIEKPYNTTVTLRKEEVQVDRTEPATSYDPGDNE